MALEQMSRRHPWVQALQHLRVLGPGSHQHFHISLYKLLKDTGHLLPASRGLEVSTAGAISFLKVGKECQGPTRLKKRIWQGWGYLPGPQSMFGF